MEKQRKLIEFTGKLKIRQRTITKLQPNKFSLELEKEKFILNLSIISDILRMNFSFSSSKENLFGWSLVIVLCLILSFPVNSINFLCFSMFFSHLITSTL